jgi:hypothetical protein
MVTLTSSTQSAEEMMEALELHGQTVIPAEPDPAAKLDPSVTPEKPSESPSVDPPAESATASEAEKKPQETQAAKPGETPPAEPKPQRGNFESRRKSLERQVDRLQDELEHERGSKTKIEAQLAEMQAKLAKLEPAEAPKVEGPVRPTRPAFPRREADDYDGSKYEAAVSKYDADARKYDDDMEAYRVAVSDRSVNEAIAKKDKERQAQEAQAAIDRQNAEIRAKISEQAKEFEDFAELVEAMPEEPVPTTPDFDRAIEASERPAILIRHFMLDFLDHNSVDRERLLKLSPHRMVMELGRLEDKLIAEKNAAPVPAPKKEVPPVVAPPAPATEPPKPPERPARPRQQPQPEAPIEPVGSRAGNGVVHLDSAKTMSEYIRMRGAGANR